jgi:3-hydroxybutyryl-CoA dehydratase
MMTNIRPHERFTSRITLTPTSVSEFARSAGDYNPIHYDAGYAAQSRYRRPIASGTQTIAHLMALTATHFSQRGAMVGLEFWFRFRQPIFVDETISLEWLVVAVNENARLGGNVVELRGRIRNAAGATAVGAKGRVLVTKQL